MASLLDPLTVNPICIIRDDDRRNQDFSEKNQEQTDKKMFKLPWEDRKPAAGKSHLTRVIKNA